MAQLDEPPANLGPVEVAVIGFDTNKRFKGEIAPALADVVDAGVVRIIDLVFVTKDANGAVRAMELSDADEDVAEVMSMLTEDVTGLLSEDDVREIGEQLQPDSSAAMIVFEHAWARRLREAILRASGRLIAQERIPAEVVERARAARVTAPPA
jgi:hypothetical protein